MDNGEIGVSEFRHPCRTDYRKIWYTWSRRLRPLMC